MQQRLLKLLVPIVLLFLAQPVMAYLQPGEPAPGFSLPDLSSKTFSLEDYRGKVVVLKLATTWCPSCKQQTEEIEALADYLNTSGVAVIDVFLQDSPEMVSEYLPKQNPVNDFVALLDDGQVRKDYNVYLIPRLLLLDRQLRVLRDGGLLPAGELKKEVQKLLGE